MSIPIVAIVGRPNVGKSTLFNRLVGEARVIVEDIPGTTRDRVYGDISWEGRTITLVDTGGLELWPETDITKRIRDQVQLAVVEADVVIFVVDAKEGVTPSDLEIANLLRRAGKPIFLVANKVDNSKRQSYALEFYEMGLGDPIPVSAYHGIGVEELMEKMLATLPSYDEPSYDEEATKVAIVGRPNVGKSMLVNAILGQERVIVSPIPGTTRDPVDTLFQYEGEPMVLIDTAGIRRQGRVEMGIERYSVIRALRAIARADVAVLVTEAPEVMAAQDAHIAGYVKEALRGMVVAVNKWDLAQASGLQAASCAQRIGWHLKFFPGVPVLFVSAKFGQGVEEVLAAAKRISHERKKRIATSTLNRAVQEAIMAHSPPSRGRRQLRVYYATQTGTAPPTFVLFVNDRELLHFSYQRYLENALREAFGFEGVPFSMVFKNRGEGSSHFEKVERAKG